MIDEVIRLGRKMVQVKSKKIIGQPLIVSYGMGTDSTAMLILMRNLGIIPDYIIFADTGSEKPETYAFKPHIDIWLKKNGFPPVTVVKAESRKGYTSIYDQGLKCFTMPSLAFGGHSCSQRWKIAPIEKWCNHNIDCQTAWARQVKIIKVIGYDAGVRDKERRNHAHEASKDDSKCDNCIL